MVVNTNWLCIVYIDRIAVYIKLITWLQYVIHSGYNAVETWVPISHKAVPIWLSYTVLYAKYELKFESLFHWIVWNRDSSFWVPT